MSEINLKDIEHRLDEIRLRAEARTKLLQSLPTNFDELESTLSQSTEQLFDFDNKHLVEWLKDVRSLQTLTRQLDVPVQYANLRLKTTVANLQMLVNELHQNQAVIDQFINVVNDVPRMERQISTVDLENLRENLLSLQTALSKVPVQAPSENRLDAVHVNLQKALIEGNVAEIRRILQGDIEPLLTSSQLAQLMFDTWQTKSDALERLQNLLPLGNQPKPSPNAANHPDLQHQIDELWSAAADAPIDVLRVVQKSWEQNFEVVTKAATAAFNVDSAKFKVYTAYIRSRTVPQDALRSKRPANSPSTLLNRTGAVSSRGGQRGNTIGLAVALLALVLAGAALALAFGVGQESEDARMQTQVMLVLTALPPTVNVAEGTANPAVVLLPTEEITPESTEAVTPEVTPVESESIEPTQMQAEASPEVTTTDLPPTETHTPTPEATPLLDVRADLEVEARQTVRIPLTASLSPASNLVVETGDEVTFELQTNASSAAEIEWVFDGDQVDASLSNERRMPHTYDEPGSYFVRVTVRDAGRSIIMARQITVEAPPPRLVWTPLEGESRDWRVLNVRLPADNAIDEPITFTVIGCPDENECEPIPVMSYIVNGEMVDPEPLEEGGSNVFTLDTENRWIEFTPLPGEQTYTLENIYTNTRYVFELSQPTELNAHFAIPSVDTVYGIGTDGTACMGDAPCQAYAVRHDISVGTPLEIVYRLRLGDQPLAHAPINVTLNLHPLQAGSISIAGETAILFADWRSTGNPVEAVTDANGEVHLSLTFLTEPEAQLGEALLTVEAPDYPQTRHWLRIQPVGAATNVAINETQRTFRFAFPAEPSSNLNSVMSIQPDQVVYLLDSAASSGMDHIAATTIWLSADAVITNSDTETRINVPEGGGVWYCFALSCLPYPLNADGTLGEPFQYVGTAAPPPNTINSRLENEDNRDALGSYSVTILGEMEYGGQRFVLVELPGRVNSFTGQ